MAFGHRHGQERAELFLCVQRPVPLLWGVWGIQHGGGTGEADHRDHGGEHGDLQCRGVGEHAEDVWKPGHQRECRQLRPGLPHLQAASADGDHDGAVGTLVGTCGRHIPVICKCL